MSIQNTVDAFQQLVNADTDCSTRSMEIMERININATNKYQSVVEGQLSKLDLDRQLIVNNNRDIAKYVQQVDEITEYIDGLEKIASELDEWSKELEVKSRRLKH